MSIDGVAGLSGLGGAGGARSVDLLPKSELGAAADRFAAALDKLSPAVASDQGVAEPIAGMMNVLDRVDLQARSVSDYAREAELSGGSLTPGEVVQLTMRCQEFMFQCQLTSNIANRSSDGVQQLFRQQS